MLPTTSATKPEILLWTKLRPSLKLKIPALAIFAPFVRTAWPDSRSPCAAFRT